MANIGILSSRFMPMHMGHVYAITRAACMVDKLFVILTHDRESDIEECNKHDFKYIQPEVRLRWIRQVTKDMINVRVISIEGVKATEVTDKIKSKIKDDITTVFTVTADEKRDIQQYFPTAQVVTIKKEKYHYRVSEEDIRRDGIFKHWDYLPDAVKPYFIRKVVIVGTESSGKTTLVKYLAKVYNTNFIEEYGRLICEEMGGYDELFTPDLFPQIVYGHKMLEYEGYKQSNKVVFVDTEAIVTQYFKYLHDGQTDDVVEMVAKSQSYDLWIYLEPDIAWIDDGLRVYGEEELRKQNSRFLKKMLEERGIDFKIIRGTYNERMEQAIKLVDDLLAR